MKVNGIDTTDISTINGIDIINILSFNGVEIPPKYLLDEYPTASIAVALFKLRSAYTGNCIRIRRASNSNEQDIGFDSNGDLDEAAINSFCSGTNCFIRTVYDQSGNANNITQTTTSRQPQIYGSGSIFYQNGLPCLRGNGTSTGMVFTQVTAGGDSVFGVFKTDNTNINHLLGTSITTYNQYRTYLNQFEFGRVINPYLSGTPDGSCIILTGVSTDQHIFYMDFGSSDLEGSVDNVMGTSYIKYGTESVNFNQFMALRIGQGGQSYLDGDAQLMIIYNGSKRSEASDIVTFINNKFTVY
jgi:hypothetical protein